jgi:chromobox protein 5
VSLGVDDFDICRNADELISRYLDELSKKKAAEKKKSSVKSRKSVERPQEPKKRGRTSTKSRVASDDEEPERSPVQPTTKKQKKEKAPAPAKKTESKQEQEHDIDFVTMEKYMDLDMWDSLIERVETIERDDDQNLYVYGVLYGFY